jgi:predicted ATP-grasp superfamily ATP-dependent carboligase
MRDGPLVRGDRVLVAGVSARAMAESAARAGYAVTSLDAFGDLDRPRGVTALSVPRDFGTPFSAAAAARASLSVAAEAVAYLSPFENHPSSLRRLAEARTLLGNDATVLRRARDPSVVAELLGANRAVAHIGEPNTGEARWLLKPRASGGGHGIRWWQPGDVVPKGSYVQQFVDGVAGSIVFVAAHGKATPLGLTRQLIGEPAFGASGFRYCGSVLAPAGDAQFDRDDELIEAATRLADVAARELGLVGLNGIDFVARQGVPVPVEINPRWSASMELVERAYGVSMFDIHANACTSGDLSTFDIAQARARARTFGKAIIFARHPIVCDDTASWLADSTVRDVPHGGEHIAAGRPVCTVFAEGADSALCLAALETRAAAVYATLDRWSTVPA